MDPGEVRWDGRSRMWLATTHADCAVVLRDPRFSAALGQRQRARRDALPPSMLTTDGAEHQRLRAPGALLLGPAAVRSVAPGLTEDVSALMSALAAGPRVVEAVGEIGRRFATAVFGRLFGMDAQGCSEFTALAEGASVNLDPMAGPERAARGRAAMGELTGFLDRQADAANDCPLAALAAHGRLSRAETLGVLGLAVVGGWQPLAEMIGNALFHLLRGADDAVRTLIKGDPEAARLVVDELLRLEAPIPFTVRVAVEDVALPTGTVPAGGRVLIAIAAANRDPAVFDRPDELVPARRPNPHLAFGAGPHFCLAAQLVREAGALLLPALLSSFPGLAFEREPLWDPRPIPRRLLGSPVDLGVGA